MMLDSSHLSPDRGLPDQWLKTKCSQVLFLSNKPTVTNSHFPFTYVGYNPLSPPYSFRSKSPIKLHVSERLDGVSYD